MCIINVILFTDAIDGLDHRLEDRVVDECDLVH
jgi:hypothetical protein